MLKGCWHLLRGSHLDWSFLAVGFLTMRNGVLDYEVASSYYTTRLYEERGVKVRNGWYRIRSTDSFKDHWRWQRWKVTRHETKRQRVKGRMLKAKVARMVTDVGDENGKGKKLLTSFLILVQMSIQYLAVSWVLVMAVQTKYSSFLQVLHCMCMTVRFGNVVMKEMFDHRCWHLGIWWRRGGPFRWQSSAVEKKQSHRWWI